jgi:hypothetical protein
LPDAQCGTAFPRGRSAARYPRGKCESLGDRLDQQFLRAAHDSGEDARRAALTVALAKVAARQRPAKFWFAADLGRLDSRSRSGFGPPPYWLVHELACRFLLRRYLSPFNSLHKVTGNLLEIFEICVSGLHRGAGGKLSLDVTRFTERGPLWGQC